MLGATGTQRFEDSTRGKVVALLKRGPLTVDDIAAEVGLTDNAVRQHLAVLERDGLVRQAGVRRVTGAGKPATLYEMDPEGEALLSRAYAPVLTAVVETLADELPSAQLKRLLRGAGRKLASSMRPAPSGDLKLMARAGQALLESLGAEVIKEERRGIIVLRGAACPLASAVLKHEAMCEAVRSMLATGTGSEVTESCDRSGRPRCCFTLAASA